MSPPILLVTGPFTAPPSLLVACALALLLVACHRLPALRRPAP